MKIKTAELTGIQLDWAIAQIEADNLGLRNNPQGEADVYWLVDDRKRFYQYFQPSTEWSQMGPIIERERINLEPFKDINGEQWSADGQWDSPTPLIAAARCYVASKLGDEVEIPEELL